MDISKVLILLFVFITTIQSNISNKSLMIYSSTLLVVSFYLNAIFLQNFVLEISTFFELVSIAIILGLILKKTNITYVKSGNLYIFYFLFIAIQTAHLLFDTTSSNSLTIKPDIFIAVNPWGLVTSFILIFSFNSRSYWNYTNSRKFIYLIIAGNTLLFILILAVQLKIIVGNTSKLQEDLGGVGLKNTSTNETALIALAYVAFLFYYLINVSKSNAIMIITIVINIVFGIYVIVLSRSRLGLAALIVILTGYFIVKLKRSPVLTLFITILVMILVSPVFLIIGDMIHKRVQNDSVEVGFSTYSDNLGFTLSGRTLVWEAYISEFFVVLKKNPIGLFIGDGFGNLQLMYKRSFLSDISFVMEKVTYFPLHSDWVLTFITSGIIGLFIYIKHLVNIVIDLLKRPQFLVFVFAWILISFSAVDMLSYSPLASLLIGLGIAQKQKINVKTYGKS